jgi:Carboxypeptidase regulatory-like domain
VTRAMRTMRMTRRGLLSICLVIGGTWCLGASPAYTQMAAGQITGVVQDQDGGAVPGATITVRETRTNLQRVVVSTSEGIYTAASLAPGEYRLDVELAGFKPLRREAIRLATVFEFFRNEHLNARNYFQSSNPLKPDYRRHQYGGMAGGDRRPNCCFQLADAAARVSRHGAATAAQEGQLRSALEVFNLLNTTNFGPPAAQFGPASFGTITTALDPRVVQLAAKFWF